MDRQSPVTLRQNTKGETSFCFSSNRVKHAFISAKEVADSKYSKILIMNLFVFLHKAVAWNLSDLLVSKQFISFLSLRS